VSLTVIFTVVWMGVPSQPPASVGNGGGNSSDCEVKATEEPFEVYSLVEIGRHGTRLWCMYGEGGKIDSR
jgi:hypothetical protein